jgi:ethanolaminephosphotransferase
MFGYKFITDKGLAALAHYKYTGEDYSILVKLFLRSFWNWLIEFVPMFIAPNLITLIGFFFLLANFTAGVFLSPNLKDFVEPHILFYYFVAFNIWIYQTMDNLDGKQARRTGSSSALGELFDHGCDSLFILLIGVPFCVTLRWTPVEFFVIMVLGCTVFYSSHWEEYHTDKLILGVLANPTEIQYGFIVTLLFTSVVGSEWWTGMVEIGGTLYKKNVLYIAFVGVGIIISFISNAYVGLKHCLNNKISLQKYLDPLIPFLVIVFLMAEWAYLSSFGYNVLNQNTLAFNCILCLLFSYLCNQLVISRICRMDFTWYNNIYIIPLSGIISCILNIEEIATPVLLAILLLHFSNFTVSVTNQLATHLKIRVFVIKPKK